MNTNKILRHINAIRCLRLLARERKLSRADIARKLGLTRATVGNAISVLVNSGFVGEVSDGQSEGCKGRPGIAIYLVAGGGYFIGIDIGTKSFTYVIIDLTMKVVARLVEPAGPNYQDAKM